MTPRVTKGASVRETSHTPSLFYGSAREAFLDLLRNLPSGEARGVLLPAYIGWSPLEGSGVFDPVRESGRPYGFYSVKDDLTVDLQALEAQVHSGRFDVLLVIHYFGRVEPRLSEIIEVARNHGMVVVEDLAHGLLTSLVSNGAGHQGDVSLYSLHKMLPTGGGGFATYRNRSLLTGQVSSAPQYAVELASYDLLEITRRRRDNFETLCQLLEAAAARVGTFRLLWPRLGAHEVPQSLPVTVNGNGRDAIYEDMNSAGYGMVSLYHTLIPELGSEHPRSHWLSKHIINFPVHQDVPETVLAEVVHQFLLALESHD